MRIALSISLLIAMTSLAAAQTPAPLINPVGGALPANASIDAVLDALDRRGQTLKEFTAKVAMTEGDPDLGNVSTRFGRIWFQKKGDSDGRLRVTFDKRQDNRLVREEKIEYLLDNGWLTDRNDKKKTETRRQVVRPGQKINLLRLGEGPFPLPIGQKPQDVHEQFDVTLAPPSKDDDAALADTVHLHLVPKPGTQFSRKFGSIDVWVGRASKFPVRIVTDTPDHSDKKITTLTDLKINPEGGLKDADFKLPAIDQNDWSLNTEPYKE